MLLREVARSPAGLGLCPEDVLLYVHVPLRHALRGESWCHIPGIVEVQNSGFGALFVCFVPDKTLQVRHAHISRTLKCVGSPGRDPPAPVPGGLLSRQAEQ